MNKAKNVQLIEIWYNQMWNKWDKNIIPTILSPTITMRGSLGKVIYGHKGIETYIDYIHSLFPDFNNDIEEIISEDNKSFAKLKYTGTYKGPQTIFNYDPTNQEIEYYGAAIFTFSNINNKYMIQNVWVLGDMYGLKQQIESKL